MMRGLLPVLALGVLVDSAAGQDPTDSLRLKAVQVTTYDVFPPGQDRGFIAKVFNGLHITTRPGVVRREVLLRPGESFDSSKAAQTERNLRALRIFRRVTVDSIRSDSGLVLRVETQDAFTTRVEGTIDGSDQSTTWSVALNELNLLGTASRVGVRYRRTPDRDGVTTQFSRNRLIGGKVGVSALWDKVSDGRLLYGVVSQPFYSFSSPASWYLSGEERSQRVLRFFEGDTQNPDELQRQFWMTKVGSGWRLASSATGYLRAGFEGQLRRDDYADYARPDTVGRTVTGAVTGYLQWRAARFLVSSDFEGFGRQEDVDLSTFVHASLGFTPRAFGYDEDGVVPGVTLQSGLGWRGGFARINASALGRLVDGLAVDSGSVHVGATVVLKPRPRHMAVFHGARGWQKNPMPGAEFDLGQSLGIRGFRQHAFTGTNAFLLTTEYRYTVTNDFLNTAGLGLAAFADYGGAWYSGSRRRTGYSVGVGVRFGLTVASDLSPARFDLAYIDGDGLAKGAWRLAFGKGFVFNTNGRLDR